MIHIAVSDHFVLAASETFLRVTSNLINTNKTKDDSKVCDFDDALTSFLKYHLGLQFGFENTASNVTFLSLPCLAYWSTKGFKNDSCFLKREKEEENRD